MTINTYVKVNNRQCLVDVDDVNVHKPNTASVTTSRIVPDSGSGPFEIVKVSVEGGAISIFTEDGQGERFADALRAAFALLAPPDFSEVADLTSNLHPTMAAAVRCLEPQP